MTVRRSTSQIAALTALLLVQPLITAQGPAATPPPAAGGMRTFDTDTGQRIKVTEVAGGLVHPYSLAFPDASTMLVAERAGRLRIIRNGVLLPTPAWEAAAPPPGSPPPNNPPDALHFIELHPGFATNRLVYLSYPKYGPRGNTIAVGRGKLTGDALTDFKEIFVTDAWGTFGANPGRMLFGRDGTLYLTVGDRDALCCNGSEDNSERMRAQDLSNDFGKILRIRDDGSIPPDNPFVKRAGARPEIFTYGNRNAYGLAYHPDTGELWQSEIGPLGGDEVNILKPGANYGWPLVSYGRDYSGAPVSDKRTLPEVEDPVLFWVPSIAISGITFYTGDRFPAWRNNLFVGGMQQGRLPRTGQMQRVVFNEQWQEVRREAFFQDLRQRIRDVEQGTDGLLYVLTDERDGAVLKLEPAQ